MGPREGTASPARSGARDAWRHWPAPSAPRRARGEVRSRPSSRRGPARLGRAGPGLATHSPIVTRWGQARWPWLGPGGGGWGWLGLAVGGPGAPWDLADARAPSSKLGAQGQRWPHPFLCPYMGVGGGDSRDRPAPQPSADSGVLPRRLGPAPGCVPGVGLLESFPNCLPPRSPVGTAG